ncbi:MAG: hypothetical protein OEM52_02240, partial [bacterium]|nr:hypothetical protein [bacterium]
MNGWHKEAFVAKSGKLSARWVHDDGRVVHIHSRIDPQQEAERIAAQLHPRGEQLIYRWCGVGLGYAAELFLQKLPDFSLLILDDPDPDARAFLEKHRPESPLLSDHHVEWQCFRSSLETPFYRSPELSSLGLASYPVKKPTTKETPQRRKQPGLQPVVLYLKSGYHLESELLAALRAEGVTVVEISFWQRNTFVERLLEAVEATHPSLLLTISHLGFD